MMGESQEKEEWGWAEDAQPPSHYLQAAAAASSVAAAPAAPVPHPAAPMPHPATPMPHTAADALPKINSTTHRAEYMKLVS